MERQMTRNYVYELVCRNHKGWGLDPTGLWSPMYATRASRIFATAAEAKALCRDMRNAGCWVVEDEDGTHEEIPEFSVEKISVYEALWMDPEEDGDVIDHILELRGGRPIRFRSMPLGVVDFLTRKYSRLAGGWAAESARLAGASSATYTARMVSGVYASRLAELADLAAQRGSRA
jgi:hypothetical protein